eukprot:6211766-Pleurochrysis_carterae.AAC.2
MLILPATYTSTQDYHGAFFLETEIWPEILCFETFRRATPPILAVCTSAQNWCRVAYCSGTSQALAALESEMIELLGRSATAAQTSDWNAVADCASFFESLVGACRNKANGAGRALRVLRSGIKPVGSDEGRARSALALLMLLEWCVPTCHESFRRELSSERWMRRLVELGRKDSSAQRLVHRTVSQLLVNWAEWYGGDFQNGVAMLSRQGEELPSATRMPDGSETPRGPPALVQPHAPRKLGPASQQRAANVGESALNAEVGVRAEMAVMRDDVEVLRRALEQRKQGALDGVELAEAKQACTDCSGWLQRLSQLLGAGVSGQQTPRRAAEAEVAGALSDEIKAELAALQRQMAEVHRTFQARILATRAM